MLETKFPASLPPLWLRTWPLSLQKQEGPAVLPLRLFLPLTAVLETSQLLSSPRWLAALKQRQRPPSGPRLGLLRCPEGPQGSPNSLSLSSSLGPPSRSLSPASHLPHLVTWSPVLGLRRKLTWEAPLSACHGATVPSSCGCFHLSVFPRFRSKCLAGRTVLTPAHMGLPHVTARAHTHPSPCRGASCREPQHRSLLSVPFFRGESRTPQNQGNSPKFILTGLLCVCDKRLPMECHSRAFCSCWSLLFRTFRQPWSVGWDAFVWWSAARSFCCLYCL